MPTRLPRLNVTISEEQHALLMRLGALQGRSAASYLRELLDASTPFLAALMPTLEAAKAGNCSWQRTKQQPWRQWRGRSFGMPIRINWTCWSISPVSCSRRYLRVGEGGGCERERAAASRLPAARCPRLVTRGSGHLAQHAPSALSRPFRRLDMGDLSHRFDWYQATVQASQPALLAALLADLPEGVTQALGRASTASRIGSIWLTMARYWRR